MKADPLPELPVGLNLIELGWLTFSASLWQRAREGDRTARSIYLKFKAAAIAGGVVWYYGDPWPQSSGKS